MFIGNRNSGVGHELSTGLGIYRFGEIHRREPRGLHESHGK